MHQLMDSVCRELDNYEKQGITRNNVEMVDKLVNIKKNLMKIDGLEDEGYSQRYSMRRDGYSRDDYSNEYNHDSSYRRRYSRDTVSELEMLMHNAKSEREKEALRKAMRELDK